jgi:hypothetical protein
METLPVDAETYRQFVEMASRADQSASDAFLTQTADQAAVAVEYLIRRATQFVLILTERLDPQVYCNLNVREATIQFLERIPPNQSDPVIWILHTEPIDTDRHDLLQAVRSYELTHGKRYLTTLQVPEDMHRSYEFGFLLADGGHYLFHSKKSDPSSLVKFNDPEMARRIQDIFVRIWTNAIQKQRAAAEAPSSS